MDGPDPVRVAAACEHLPGTAWVAVGYRGKTLGDLSRAARTLAARYLRPGGSFSVDAEVSGGHPSDLAGALTSAILGSVKGSRVDEEGAMVRFKAALDEESGVVGVRLRDGPGGAPTGGSEAVCLVSGGAHSSVVAWMTVLSGQRVTMVHASEGERGVRGVARLYAELSHRSDPLGLRLVVLEGAPPDSMLYGFVSRSKAPAFGGFTPLSGLPPASFRGRVHAPLYMATEEYFDTEFRGLGTPEVRSKTEWKGAGKSRFTVREFGGERADVSGVLDGLA